MISWTRSEKGEADSAFRRAIGADLDGDGPLAHVEGSYKLVLACPKHPGMGAKRAMCGPKGGRGGEARSSHLLGLRRAVICAYAHMHHGVKL